MCCSLTNHQARSLRNKQTAEVFTPPRLVNQMLSRLPIEVWKKDRTFCDPSCGNGNFLIAVLIRKIQRGHDPLLALQSIFGVDIQRDNIQECRLRLLKVIQLFGHTITEDHIKAVWKNVVWVNIENHPGGSLDYDFEFTSTAKAPLLIL